ncbi:MAG: NADH-specific enoyl-ACP reductase [Epsilonproteobacteria bacterium]|jgi:enoyl-[acyl-carrier protein] reductase I|nr:NADH-specific enoyl-ACP reductase [Campylobacterota bacterium]NPA89470.1 SDR family oxidoreductase [Campylobacterota bacterium]
MFMEGKKGLIVGVANNHSIAYGIAKAIKEAGGDFILTYQNEKLKKRVAKVADQLGVETILPLDFSKEGELTQLREEVEKIYPQLDFIVHSVAFAPREALDGRFLDTSKEAFKIAMDISVYSLIELVREFEPLLKEGSSIVTMTYLGANRYIPHYNVMGVAKSALETSIYYMAVDLGAKGVRINGISAGPVKTLAASGIGDFSQILSYNKKNSPLRRNITIDEVGKAGVFLLSDYSSGITGEILYVDSGYHIMGMPLYEKEKENK